MLPYIFILVLSMPFAMIESLSGRPIKSAGKLIFALTWILVFFISFRGNGYDFGSYLDLFKLIKEGIIYHAWDSGFVVMCQLCPSFTSLLFLMAVLTMLPLYWVIKYESPFMFLSMLLFTTTFLFPTVMGQMRQGVAIFVMLYAYYRWKDNKLVFLCLWLLCCTIHSSAPIALLMLFTPKRLFPIKSYLFLIVISILVSDILKPIFTPFIQGLSVLEDSNAVDRLNFYDSTETQHGVSIGMNSAMLIRITVLLLAYYTMKWKYKHDASVFNIYFFSIFFYLLLGFIPQLGGRGSQYFVVFDIIIIPEILRYSKKKMRYIVALAFILLSILRFHQFFADSFNAKQYLPYHIEMTT